MLIADANTGWLRHQAMRRAVQDVDVYVEQPCLTTPRRSGRRLAASRAQSVEPRMEVPGEPMRDVGT